MALVPCPSCSRHVATNEASCPFCASALPADFTSRAIPGATRRLSRAAMFTFATTLTAVGAVAACSSSSSSGPTPSGSDGAVQDDGQVQAAYGCPEPECGQEDAGPVLDDGSVGALYGASFVDASDGD